MLQIVPKGELMKMVGSEFGPSEWLEVDQDRINQFADATLDHQFIHVDEDLAKQTPFGGTIAHGYLSLSLLPHLVTGLTVLPENTIMVVNYGIDRLRFLAPVKSGSEVRARVKLLDVTEKGPGRLLIKTEATLEINGDDKPALVAETLTMAVTAG